VLDGADSGASVEELVRAALRDLVRGR